MRRADLRDLHRILTAQPASEEQREAVRLLFKEIGSLRAEMIREFRENLALLKVITRDLETARASAIAEATESARLRAELATVRRELEAILTGGVP